MDRALDLLRAGLVAVGCALLLGCNGDDNEPSQPATGAAFPQKLHSEAPGKDGDVSRAFVDSRDRRLVLNGFNVFPVFPDSPEVAWDASHYRSIAGKGFNAVRFLMPWREYEPERGRFANFDKLDTAIGYARDAGLYVVLVPFLEDQTNEPPGWAQASQTSGCINNDPTGDRALDKILSEGKRYLQEVARRYRGNDVVAALDLIGEPHGTNRQNCLLGLLSTLIDWVREVDEDKIVILEPGWGSTNMSPKFVDPRALRHRDNVVHSWHFYYAGGEGAGYNEFGMNSSRSTGDGKGGYPDTSKEGDLEAQVQIHVDYARRAGLPLFVGEYGVNPRAPNATAWAQQVTKLLDEHDIGRMWWLYDEKDSGFAPKDSSGRWLPIVDVLRR